VTDASVFGRCLCLGEAYHDVVLSIFSVGHKRPTSTPLIAPITVYAIRHSRSFIDHLLLPCLSSVAPPSSSSLYRLPFSPWATLVTIITLHTTRHTIHISRTARQIETMTRREASSNCLIIIAQQPPRRPRRGLLTHLLPTRRPHTVLM
jgi:hypothetical protein